MKKKSIITLMLFFATLTIYAQKAKYVFYFIGDGMGLNVVNAAECYKGYIENGTLKNIPLTFTSFPVFGIATTNAANRYITDSAAAGTALATGQKTSPGTIGMTTDRTTNLKSIAYDAKESKKAVGIVSTVSIDHATPASFFANQPERGMSYEIAMDGYKNGFDLYGGAGFVEPQKGDNPEVYSAYKEAGYTIIKGKAELQKLNNTTNKALLIERDQKYATSLAYAIDRTNEDLTLSDLVSNSINYLESKGGKNGFFIMAEGGKIDWAAHNNDGITAIVEVLDLDNAIKIAYEFYKKHPKETLIVVTADHETGGYTFGRSETAYETHANFFDAQKVSVDKMGEIINEHAKSWIDCKALLTSNFGLWDKIKVSKEDEQKMILAFYDKKSNVAPIALNSIMKSIGIGWTSGTHTGSPVGVYAIGVGSDKFTGKQDNTDIPKKIKSTF